MESFESAQIILFIKTYTKQTSGGIACQPGTTNLYWSLSAGTTYLLCSLAGRTDDILSDFNTFSSSLETWRAEIDVSSDHVRTTRIVFCDMTQQPMDLLSCPMFSKSSHPHLSRRIRRLARENFKDSSDALFSYWRLDVHQTPHRSTVRYHDYLHTKRLFRLTLHHEDVEPKLEVPYSF